MQLMTPHKSYGLLAAVLGQRKYEGQRERHDDVGAQPEQLLGVLGDGADARPVAAVPASTGSQSL